MITLKTFSYKPSDHEAERASNSYLMSVIALMVGMPFPIVNLIATFIFYLGNRKSTYFVRWHCMQALLSQISLFIPNAYSFYWTISILMGEKELNNDYFAFVIIVAAVNFIEFLATIYTATKSRKGIHVEWMFYGDLANLICPPKS